MQKSRTGRVAVLSLAAAILVAGCTTSSTGSSTTVASTAMDSGTGTSAAPAGCAEVVDVAITLEDGGTYRFDVTVRSPDTGWDKYADKWEVRAPDGRVLGERVLAHPHVDEQPFTRSQSGIDVPTDVTVVAVVARDSVAGFCGTAYEVQIP